jgi:hypothetical protein
MGVQEVADWVKNDSEAKLPPKVINKRSLF